MKNWKGSRRIEALLVALIMAGCLLPSSTVLTEEGGMTMVLSEYHATGVVTDYIIEASDDGKADELRRCPGFQ